MLGPITDGGLEASEGGQENEPKEAMEEEREQVDTVELKMPIKPSQAEVDRHNLNHATFRDWCEFCVKGRGKEMPHKNQKGEPMAEDMICIDYFVDVYLTAVI